MKKPKRVRHNKRRRRLKPPSPRRFDGSYWQLWRLIDGAVRDTFFAHPEYLACRDRETVVRNSINKRAVSQVLSWARERARGCSHSDGRP